MAAFNYTALDATNTFVNGRIEAGNSKTAVKQLEREGFVIVNIKEEKRPRFGGRFNIVLNGISAQEKIFFTRNLYTMLEAGISLDHAIKTTAEQTTNEKFGGILMKVHGELQKGQPLHVALLPHKDVFHGYYINMIKIGEMSGRLDDVLSYLLEKLEKDQELLMKARGAMIYPVIILIALIVMVTGMLIYVIPRITNILNQYDVTLPLATRVLLWLSNFMVHNGVYLFIVFIIAGFAFYKTTRKGNARWRWHSFVLVLPGISMIVKEYNLARFARSTSALLRSGLGLDQALGLTAGVSSNSHYERSLTGAIKFVQRGIPFSEVLKGNPTLYPPLVTRMIEVGEKSGKLDHMLSRLAEYYEKSVSNKLSNISSVIEPVLLLLIGLSVGYVAIAVLTPIWSFSQTI